MSDLQLERSVLESKERDELFAIAKALGSSPTARTKKADLVSHILQATGVEDAPAPADKPKRGRPRRTAASAEPATGDSAEQLELAPAGASQRNGSALDATGSGSGSAGAGGSAVATDGPDSVVGPSLASVNGTGANGTSVNNTGVNNTGVNNTGVNGTGANSRSGIGRRTNGTSVVPTADADGRAGAPAQGDGPGTDGAAAEQVDGQPSGGARSEQFRGRNDRGERGDRGERADRNDRNDRNDRSADNDGGLGNSRRRRRRNRDKPQRGGGQGQGQEREMAPSAASEANYSGELVTCSGLLDLRDEGYGFLRANGYLSSSSDVYVSITQVRRYGLRKGDLVEGAYRPAANNEKYPALVRVDSVAGASPDEARNRPKFESLTPLFPDDKLALEVPGDPGNVTARIVDLVSPIGKGQRGLIVSPPKAGKTTVLKQIAHSIEANNPNVHLMVLLVDERPEEVTDMRRSVKGEVIASTFDRPADEHTQVAELAIERAKRLVEMGRDVVIVLDGITRLARAYNLAQPATGRIMSGGIDTGALYPPKKFFGSARNIEEGGSLTILATALVETGSKMDEVIFEEFKGTGNMELRLDRKLAERRLYPAIDVNGSSTRHEELLFDRAQLQQVWKLRRVLNALATDGNAAAGLELLVDKIRSTRSNDQFLADIAKTPAPAI
ncbi:MAG TPA: transcription termination factor Rho [Acidimicrobiales bacterium]|nr:transcription termination factor Rho [Acidimicrobiales bacterium]